MQLLEGLDHLVVQDIFLTRTAELADVVLPASASWCEAEGTVTNSERRVQRVRKALEPPGRGARRHRDRRASWPPAGARLGPCRRRGGLERAALALADARADELSRGSRSWRHPVAVLRRGAPRRAVPPRPAVGEPITGPPAPFNVVEHEPAGRRLRTSSRSGSPPAGGSTRTTPACRAAATARRCGAARRSTSRPRTRAARRRRGRAGPGDLAAGVGRRRRCASTGRCARASRS